MKVTLTILGILILGILGFLVGNENRRLAENQPAVVNTTDIEWRGKIYRYVDAKFPAPLPPPDVKATVPKRGELICRDGEWKLYRMKGIAVSDLIIRENGAGDVSVFETLDGTREYADEAGVDWAILEGCRAAFLYYNSPPIRQVALFAPQGFDLKALYRKPYMGAKHIRVTQKASDLKIEVLK